MSDTETIKYEMNEGEGSLTPPSSPYPPITSEEEDPTPLKKGGGTSKRRSLIPPRKGWWSTLYRKVKFLRIVHYFVLSVTGIEIYLL